MRPCDEMAATLIVWHRAAAPFCQKSSSDSPTGMMAHLTNASTQNGPTTPVQQTEESADADWKEERIISDWYQVSCTDPGLGHRSKPVTSTFAAAADCVFYSKSSILSTRTTRNTSTAVPCVNNKSSRCLRTRAMTPLKGTTERKATGYGQKMARSGRTETKRSGESGGREKADACQRQNTTDLTAG